MCDDRRHLLSEHHVTFHRVVEGIPHTMPNSIYQTGRLDHSDANESMIAVSQESITNVKKNR